MPMNMPNVLIICVFYYKIRNNQNKFIFILTLKNCIFNYIFEFVFSDRRLYEIENDTYLYNFVNLKVR